MCPCAWLCVVIDHTMNPQTEVCVFFFTAQMPPELHVHMKLFAELQCCENVNRMRGVMPVAAAYTLQTESFTFIPPKLGRCDRGSL